MNENQQNKYPVSSGIVCLRDLFRGDKSLRDVITKNYKSEKVSKLEYTIPFYQRPYQWSWKDKELKGLFDAFVSMPENEDDEPEIKNSKTNSEDYLVFGSIQLNEIDDNKFEIIDGQQRLTSFWLLLKALDCIESLNLTKSLSFELQNYISDELNDQYNNYEKNDRSVYGSNYLKLKTEIEYVRQKCSSEFPAKEFGEFILDNVLFSLMISTYKNDIQKSIKLFDSLNTKGLDLDVKDVFKLKYYEYITNSYKSISVKDVFGKINLAYNNCSKVSDQMYLISENDLLDAFKLWIIFNDSDGVDQQYLAKKIKASPQLFFNDNKYKVWQDSRDDSSKSYKGLNAFFDISESIRQTQENIISLDSLGPTDNLSLCLLSTYELIQICGYWYFRNIVFVLAHVCRMSKSEKTLTKEDIVKVLELCQWIWKVCSITKVRDYRVVDDILKSVMGIFFLFFKKENSFEESIIQAKREFSLFFKDRNNYIIDFKNQIEGEIYSTRQCRFLMVLLYLHDCDDHIGDICWRDQKERLFYLTQKEGKNRKFEIEHIVSHVFKGVDGLTDLSERIDHIGNLVFLSASINKALGLHTALIVEKNKKNKSGLLDDFTTKITDEKYYIKDKALTMGQNKTKKDVNISILGFLDSIRDRNIKEASDITKIIFNRDQERQNIINDIYLELLND